MKLNYANEEEAVKIIRSTEHVFMHGCAAPWLC